MTDQKARERSERRQRVFDETQAIRSRAETDLCPAWVPQEAREAVWRKAWEDGHSSGETEVRHHYDELMDIVRLLAPSNKES